MPTPASHVWKPSTARTVVLDSFIPVPRGSAAIAPPPLNWPTKDPADVLDYQFDVSPALVGNDGDAVETLDVSIEPANPGDLTLNSCNDRWAGCSAVAVRRTVGDRIYDQLDNRDCERAYDQPYNSPAGSLPVRSTCPAECSGD